MQVQRNYVKLVLGVILFTLGCTSPGGKENNSAESNVVVLDPLNFRSKLDSTSDAVLIDVRTPEEISEGMIEGAINIDFKDSKFNEKISALNKEQPYFVYCLSGKRSADAIKQMEELGFKNIFTLKDGYRNWTEQGFDIVKP